MSLCLRSETDICPFVWGVRQTEMSLCLRSETDRDVPLFEMRGRQRCPFEEWDRQRCPFVWGVRQREMSLCLRSETQCGWQQSQYGPSSTAIGKNWRKWPCSSHVLDWLCKNANDNNNNSCSTTDLCRWVLRCQACCEVSTWPWCPVVELALRSVPVALWCKVRSLKERNQCSLFTCPCACLYLLCCCDIADQNLGVFFGQFPNIRSTKSGT